MPGILLQSGLTGHCRGSGVGRAV